MIEVFSRSNCKWCDIAKSALAERGHDWREIDVQADQQCMDEFTERTSGARTVPQIFVGGRLIGGAIELLDIIDTKPFQEMIGGS